MLIGCNILSRLHTGEAAVLGPAVIHMLGPGMPGYVSWMQPKLGCNTYTKILMPAAGGVSLVSTMALPPLPTKTLATFESEGIHLSEEHKKQLTALAIEQDA